MDLLDVWLQVLKPCSCVFSSSCLHGLKPQGFFGLGVSECDSLRPCDRILRILTIILTKVGAIQRQPNPEGLASSIKLAINHVKSP